MELCRGRDPGEDLLDCEIAGAAYKAAAAGEKAGMGEKEGAELRVDGAYEGHTSITGSAKISLTAVLLLRVVNAENRCNSITLRVDSYSSPTPGYSIVSERL